MDVTWDRKNNKTKTKPNLKFLAKSSNQAKNWSRIAEIEKPGWGEVGSDVWKEKKTTGYILVSVIWTRSANDANRTIDFLKSKNEGLYHSLKGSIPILKTWNVEIYVTDMTAKDK